MPDFFMKKKLCVLTNSLICIFFLFFFYQQKQTFIGYLLKCRVTSTSWNRKNFKSRVPERGPQKNNRTKLEQQQKKLILN